MKNNTTINEEPLFTIKDEMYWMDAIQTFLSYISIPIYVFWITYDFGITSILQDRDSKILILFSIGGLLFYTMKIVVYSIQNKNKIEFYSDRIVSTHYNRVIYLNDIDEGLRLASLFIAPNDVTINRTFGIKKAIAFLIILPIFPFLFPAIFVSSQLVHMLYRAIHHRTVNFFPLVPFRYAYMSIVDKDNRHIVIVVDGENDTKVNEYLENNFGVSINSLPTYMIFAPKKNSNIKKLIKKQ